MYREETPIASVFNRISKNNTLEDVDKMAKHLADLHNRRITEKDRAEKLVENMRKERFSTLISKADFLKMYWNYRQQ